MNRICGSIEGFKMSRHAVKRAYERKFDESELKTILLTGSFQIKNKARIFSSSLGRIVVDLNKNKIITVTR